MFFLFGSLVAVVLVYGLLFYLALSLHKSGFPTRGALVCSALCCFMIFGIFAMPFLVGDVMEEQEAVLRVPVFAVLTGVFAFAYSWGLLLLLWTALGKRKALPLLRRRLEPLVAAAILLALSSLAVLFYQRRVMLVSARSDTVVSQDLEMMLLKATFRGDVDLMAALATNLQASPAFLRRIHLAVGAPDYAFRFEPVVRALVFNPNTPGDVLSDIAESPFLELRAWVYRHPNLSDETMEAVAKSGSSEMKRHLLSNPNVKTSVVRALLDDPDPRVRHWAAWQAENMGLPEASVHGAPAEQVQ